MIYYSIICVSFAERLLRGALGSVASAIPNGSKNEGSGVGGIDTDVRIGGA